MKKLYTLLALVITLITNAQAPQGFNYQATVRNSAGALIVNQNVNFKFNIMLNSATSLPVFSETHMAPTDDLGQVNLVIGTGTATTGSFSTINWGTGNYYLGIELNTGAGYIAMGTTQLLSVPYALYANSAGNSQTTTPSLASVLAVNNSANNTKITNLANPTNAQDAVTKSYLENQLLQIPYLPLGNNNGDMLIWNDNNWTIKNIGIPGQVLYIDESNIPNWGFTPIITQISCFQSNNGAISLNLPFQINNSYYTYHWTGPNNFTSNAPKIANLFPGIYNLDLTHNGETTTLNFTITEPLELLIQNTNIIDVTCFGGNDGQFTVNVTQGIFGNYTFTLNGTDYLGNQITESVANTNQSHTFLGLKAGSYNVIVTSDTGCEISSGPGSISINQPSATISNIPGTYALVVTDGNVQSSFANEIITQESINNYKTTRTGLWNLGVSPSQGFYFRENCGNLEVRDQNLFQYYSNRVYQTPTQFLNSSKNQSSGVITIHYSIYFAAGDREYINVYTPN